MITSPGKRLGLRARVLMLALTLSVLAQLIYAGLNISAFQREHLAVLQEKTAKLSGFLKNDIEYVLSLRIPITRLVGVEQTLGEVLKVAPEIQFIEITDLDGYVLYYADHQSMEQVSPGTRSSLAVDPEANAALEDLGLSLAEVDTRVTIQQPRSGETLGHLLLRLDPQLVRNQAQEVFFDMATVILTSLLIVFEFLSFIITYGIGEPLQRLEQQIGLAVRQLKPLSHEDRRVRGEIAKLLGQFNRLLERQRQRVEPFQVLRSRFTMELDGIRESLSRQRERLATLQATSAESGRALARRLTELHGAVEELAGRLALATPFLEAPAAAAQATTTGYWYIRPFIFTVMLADGLSNSFMPLYVDTLYQPIDGLSRELVLALPLSLFMLCVAFVMPMAGGWSDRVGWYRPLIIGTVLTLGGQVLTALAPDLFQLLAARAINGIGFGMLMITCQRFVISHTTSVERTRGMGAFVAALFSGDVVGTVIGAMLATRIGYPLVFLVGAIALVPALGYALTILRGQHHAGGPVETTGTPTLGGFPVRDAFRVLADREFLGAVLLQAIPAKIVIVGFLSYLVPLYLESAGVLQSNIGRVIMCYSVALFLLSPVITRYFNRPERRRLYVLGAGVVAAVALLLLQISSGVLMVLLTVVLLGAAHALLSPSQFAIISELEVVKRIGVGSGIGLFRFWERFGSVIGPLVMGVLIGVFGYEHAIVGLGLIILGCNLLYLLLIIPRHRRAPTAETASAPAGG